MICRRDSVVVGRGADEVVLMLDFVMKIRKTIVLTNEIQPPPHLYSWSRERIEAKTGHAGYKWLGCILGVSGAGRSSLDLQHRVQTIFELCLYRYKKLRPGGFPVFRSCHYFWVLGTPKKTRFRNSRGPAVVHFPKP